MKKNAVFMMGLVFASISIAHAGESKSASKVFTNGDAGKADDVTLLASVATAGASAIASDRYHELAEESHRVIQGNVPSDPNYYKSHPIPKGHVLTLEFRGVTSSPWRGPGVGNVKYNWDGKSVAELEKVMKRFEAAGFRMAESPVIRTSAKSSLVVAGRVFSKVFVVSSAVAFERFVRGLYLNLLDEKAPYCSELDRSGKCSQSKTKAIAKSVYTSADVVEAFHNSSSASAQAK
jgi:hypothetical protein